VLLLMSTCWQLRLADCWQLATGKPVPVSPAVAAAGLSAVLWPFGSFY
jgi:hypothetical protein